MQKACLERKQAEEKLQSLLVQQEKALRERLEHLSERSREAAEESQSCLNALEQHLSELKGEEIELHGHAKHCTKEIRRLQKRLDCSKLQADVKKGERHAREAKYRADDSKVCPSMALGH